MVVSGRVDEHCAVGVTEVLVFERIKSPINSTLWTSNSTPASIYNDYEQILIGLILIKLTQFTLKYQTVTHSLILRRCEFHR